MKVISILGWKEAVKCQAIKLEADHIQLHLGTKTAIAFSSYGCACSRTHSRYSRKLADPPWAGKPAQIIVQVCRFFCENMQCHQKTFAERLITAPAYARKPVRLNDQLLQLRGAVNPTTGHTGKS